MSLKKINPFSSILMLAILLSACVQATPFQPANDTVVTQTAAIAIDPPAATEPAVASTEAPQPDVNKANIKLPVVDPAKIQGDITSAGSSTVFPLSEAIATLFESEGYPGQITIDSIGTGGGFERFCKAGETDIVNASRAIKDSEVENCLTLNPTRNPVEFRVGTDAIAVVVTQENDFLSDVTKAELAKIFSKDAVKWSDIRPEWPAEDILRYTPGTDSGTFDFFIESVMDPAYVVDKEADKGKGEEAFLSASNLQMSEDDNVLVQGVEGSPYAVGFFGFAYYHEEGENLKAVAIDDVIPDAQSAESGTYPLARPLFIYSDADIMKSKPQVADFINFYLERVDEVISDVGYFPASAESLDSSRQTWLNIMK